MTLPDSTETSPAPADPSASPAKLGPSGRLAIRGLILQAVIVVVIFLPWVNPDALVASGISTLWADLFMVAFFAILPLSIAVIVAGGISVASGSTPQKKRGWIAIGGAIFVFGIAIWAILAGLSAAMM